MGLFDYIHFSMDCPNCGERLPSFQSKDAECDMTEIEPDGVGNFYSLCHKCKAWVEFVRPLPPSVPLRETSLTLEEVEKMGFVMSVIPGPGS